MHVISFFLSLGAVFVLPHILTHKDTLYALCVWVRSMHIWFSRDLNVTIKKKKITLSKLCYNLQETCSVVAVAQQRLKLWGF